MPKASDTNGPDIDPDTAYSEEQTTDFADEHASTTVANAPGDDSPGESVPTDHGGMDLGTEDPP